MEDPELEARVSDLLGRPMKSSLPQCERCGLTLVRGVPKMTNTLATIRSTGSYYQGCDRTGCRYTGSI